jgi:hypothetical protein
MSTKGVKSRPKEARVIETKEETPPPRVSQETTESSYEGDRANAVCTWDVACSC